MYKTQGLGRIPIDEGGGRIVDDPIVINTSPTVPVPIQLVPWTAGGAALNDLFQERKNISEALLIVPELNERQLEHLVFEADNLSSGVKTIFEIALDKRRGLVPDTTPLVKSSFVPYSSDRLKNIDIVSQAGLIPEIGSKEGLIAAAVFVFAVIFFGDSKPKKNQIGF